MSKLLPTRLPISNTPQVEADTYNRLIRILEINLGAVDPDNTQQVTTTRRDEGFFNNGSIVFNSNLFASQFYATNDLGLSSVASLGTVSVTT